MINRLKLTDQENVRLRANLRTLANECTSLADAIYSGDQIDLIAFRRELVHYSAEIMDLTEQAINTIQTYASKGKDQKDEDQYFDNPFKW